MNNLMEVMNKLWMIESFMQKFDVRFCFLSAKEFHSSKTAQICQEWTSLSIDGNHRTEMALKNPETH